MDPRLNIPIKRVNPFDNKNVAKRAIIAFFFLGALRRKDHCCEQY